MLFNRLLSFAVLIAVAGHTLGAPLPMPRSFEFEAGPAEVEVDRKEAEVEVGDSEVEVKGLLPGAMGNRMARRDHPTRSLSASLEVALEKLNALSPKIDEAMNGPIGSIEKMAGRHLTSVHLAVHDLESAMQLFHGDDRKVLYQNADGTGELSDSELAERFSKFFLCISDIEEDVRHVSGFAVTSAQLSIRNDLVSMKKSMTTLLPVVRSTVANMMSMAMNF